VRPARHLHRAGSVNGALSTCWSLAVASMVVACVPSSPPLMAPASFGSLDAPAPTGEARVVFVQGLFDGWYNDHASIVDENGRLLGESWPDSWFSVDLPAGEHEFFGWKSDWAGFIPFAHACTCVATRCTEIAAMHATLVAGKTYYVFLRGVGAGGKGWAGGNAFDFLRTSPRLDQWSPDLRGRLQHIATDPKRAASLTATAGGGYVDTIVCMGRKRMRDPEAWSASKSDLRPGDGE
jgi:hypothetical protein